MFNIYNRRYTGSKLKLAEWIIDLINENCSGNSFFEVFAGTSVISSKIASQMKTVILNDTLCANKIIYQAFYDSGSFDKQKLLEYREKFQQVTNDAEGFFSKNYGGKYFSIADSRKIESIRNIIKADKTQLSEKEYSILLASLIYSMDKSANTVGHFDSYIRKGILSDKFKFDLISPIELPHVDFVIYQNDANELANKVIADIAYIDPPYNSRQYCQFYHLYETIVKWDNPELFGVALKPKAQHLSDYCRASASKVFEDLISKMQCKFLVVSYNNTYESKSSSSRNKITLQEIIDTLGKYGEVRTFSKSHQYFNAGKTSFSDHKEFLFIVKVGE